MTDVMMQQVGGACVFQATDAASQLLHCWAAVRLTDGRILTTFECGGPELDWGVARLDQSSFLLRVSFTNTSSAPLGVEQLLPLVSDTGLRSLPVSDLLMSETGWQSWTRAHPLRPFSPNAVSAPPPIRSPVLPHRQPGSQVAGWMTILHGPTASAAACLLGFLSGREQTCVVEVAPRPCGHAIRASAETEGIHLAAGETLHSEPLLLTFGEESAMTSRYADLVAEHMVARVPPTIPTGWCSWYQFSTEVAEADVTRNLTVLARQRELLPVDVVQLDDGYQREVGDWLQVRATFPSGLAALGDSIRGQGYTPGLWLAPFLLSHRSSTYAEHPDWVVRDDAGEPIVAIHNWRCAHYALDTTHPDALAWLEHVVRTVCDEWGYQYLKLDFVYAAALRGRRFESNVTGAQAYTRGMELIRRVAGSRFLLGCGAPLVSSVGVVDGMRIGSDVAPYWAPPAGASVGPSTFNALQATFARAWMHRCWWLNDPDCVLVRAHDTQLSEVEVRAWASVVALSGGMLLAGDDVNELEPERRALLGRLFPPLGQTPEPLPPLVDDAPEHVRLPIKRLWADWTIAGIANWSEVPRRATFDPMEWGLAASAFHLVDLWSGEYRGPLLGQIDIGGLAAHELRLLSVHAAVDRPAVVGSTGHALGEAMDVLDEAWDGATLRVSLAGGHARTGLLLVAVPAGWRHVATPADPPRVRAGSGLLRVPFDLRAFGDVRLQFTAEAR